MPAEHRRGVVAGVDQFKKSFGIGKEAPQAPSQKEFEGHRQKQRKALLTISPPISLRRPRS